MPAAPKVGMKKKKVMKKSQLAPSEPQPESESEVDDAFEVVGDEVEDDQDSDGLSLDDDDPLAAAGVQSEEEDEEDNEDDGDLGDGDSFGGSDADEEGSDDDDEEGEDSDDAGGDGDEEEEDGDEEDEDEMEAKEAQRFQRKLNKAAQMEMKDDMKRDHKADIESDEEEEDSDDEIRDIKRPLTVPKMRQRISYVLQVLADFKDRGKGYSRSEYMDIFLSDLRNVYDYSEWLLERFARMFPPAELIQFLDANDTPRPETIRANTLKVKRRDLAQALIKRGVNVDPLEKWSKEGLVVYESSVALGGTPEYLAGQYMLQAAASLLPVIALNPQEGEKVLDMAAAPGGKTTHICQLMKNNGIVFANDVSQERLRALSANVHRLGCSNVIVVNYNGRDLPKVCHSVDRVLLDAPCTGTGIISKDPKVKMTRTLEDLYNCTRVQKELILAAIDCCNFKSKDNYIVYSTCSVLYEENEQVVEYALQRRHVRLVDTGLPFGRPGLLKVGKCRFPPAMALCKRFYPHIHNLDGFFVAKLQKYADGPKDGKFPIPKAPLPKMTKAQKRARKLEKEAKKKEVPYRPPPENKRLTKEERAAKLAEQQARKAEEEKDKKKKIYGSIIRRKRKLGPGERPGKRLKKDGAGANGGAADGPSAKRVGFETDISGFKDALIGHDENLMRRPRLTRKQKLRLKR